MKKEKRKKVSKAAKAAEVLRKVAQAKLDVATKEAQLIVDMGEAIAALTQRVMNLEQVAGLPGPKGEKGERGEKGSGFWG